MRPFSAALLWAGVIFLLAGTVAISLTVSSINDHDPPVGIWGLVAGILVVVIMNLWLERTQRNPDSQVSHIPEAAIQELLLYMRDSPFNVKETHEELLYGLPEGFKGQLMRSDIPMVDLSSIIHTAAQWGKPCIAQVVSNALEYLNGHPRANDIRRWQRTWNV